MKKNIVLLVMLFIINFSYNCIGQPQKKESAHCTENFETFYKKFFADSLFQLSRINWPLIGGEMVAYQFEEMWKKSDFKFIVKSGKIISINKINPKKYELLEDIGGQYENSGRRFVFKLINSHWKLIEYVEFYN